uniref:Tegument protein n=1 Tax=Otarine gammaherpesvirus 4 TaxID=2801541 RepID=A0A889IW42_9GAMA|nr:Tegument protein [Otarine gammaherpesvirus 4]
MMMHGSHSQKYTNNSHCKHILTKRAFPTELTLAMLRVCADGARFEHGMLRLSENEFVFHMLHSKTLAAVMGVPGSSTPVPTLFANLAPDADTTTSLYVNGNPMASLIRIVLSPYPYALESKLVVGFVRHNGVLMLYRTPVVETNEHKTSETRVPCSLMLSRHADLSGAEPLPFDADGRLEHVDHMKCVRIDEKHNTQREFYKNDPPIFASVICTYEPYVHTIDRVYITKKADSTVVPANKSMLDDTIETCNAATANNSPYTNKEKTADLALATNTADVEHNAELTATQTPNLPTIRSILRQVQKHNWLPISETINDDVRNVQAHTFYAIASTGPRFTHCSSQALNTITVLGRSHNSVQLLAAEELTPTQRVYIKHVLLQRLGFENSIEDFYAVYRNTNMDIQQNETTQHKVDTFERLLRMAYTQVKDAIYCLNSVAANHFTQPICDDGQREQLRLAMEKYFLMFPPIDRKNATVFGAAVVSHVCHGARFERILSFMSQYMKVYEKQSDTDVVKMYALLTI